MLAKIEDLKLVDASGTPLGWAETLIVDTDEPLKVPDVDDDLARETLMYALQFHPHFSQFSYAPILHLPPLPR